MKNYMVRNINRTIVKMATVEGEITALKAVFPSGMKLSVAIESPNYIRKKELLGCMYELHCLKVPQKAIAFITNVSPSYVSRLLHK